MNPTYDFNYVTTIHVPFLDNVYEEMRSTNYAFLKGPQELMGLKIDDPGTQKLILEWLEKERSKGNRLVSAFNNSLTWLFDVTPNSVRFIKDEF